MAITQTRMLALILAAKDFQDCAERMIAYVRRSAKLVATGKTTADEQLEYLTLMFDLKTLLRDPLNSPATIITEERHFKSTAGRNRAAAARAARKRREAGVEPRKASEAIIERSEIELEPAWTTAPDLISRQAKLFGSIDDFANSPAPIPTVPQASRKPAKRPQMTGPKNARGLYDEDDNDSGPLLSSHDAPKQRTEEELMAAIQKDLERDENRAKWDELQRNKAKPENE